MKRTIFFLIFSLSVQSQVYDSQSYDASRKLFKKKVEKLRKNYQGVQSGSYKIPSQIDQNLYSDWYYLPPQERSSPRELVIMTSGIHGIESFTGSALQLMFTDKILPKIDWKNTGLLVMHSLNPFGHKFKRRVTENNVDLNRNFLKHGDHPKVLNDKYQLFDDFLNPKEAASDSVWQTISHYSQSVYYVLKHSKSDFRQATLQGQYQSPKGIFYGGKQKEPQVEKITSLIKKFGKHSNRIFHIDLHTGYGKRGELHFFAGEQYEPKEQAAIDYVFKGENIDNGNDEDFYQTLGDFTQYTSSLFPAKLVLSMTFEYGTLDSQTLTGALESLRRIRLENQGYHWGYASTGDKKSIRSNFLQLFSPSEKAWRERIFKRSKKAFAQSIRRFQKVGSLLPKGSE